MFLIWYFDLFYFFALFLSRKKIFQKFFLHTFAISYVRFDLNWHKFYYQHKIWRQRKTMIEISKNFKKCIIFLEFKCPKRGQIIPIIIDFTECRIL